MKELNIISSGSPKAEFVLKYVQRCLQLHSDIKVRTSRLSQNLPTLAIGGDGTILEAVRRFGGKSPVLGINAGTLGFLSEIEWQNGSEIWPIVDCWEKDETRIEECNALHYIVRTHIKTKRGTQRAVVKHGTAFNDVVIARDSALDCIKFSVSVNGSLIKSYNADGFVVASPVGASAYALSCGAPLVEPTSKVMVLSPIAPHTLVDRSIVADDDDIVSIAVERARNPAVKTVMCIDGHERIELHDGDTMDVVTSRKNTSRFVRLGRCNFFDRISRKLGV